MIFVDTNVIMYAVGRRHPLQKDARKFFEKSVRSTTDALCTSAEVLQELLHSYLPVQRYDTLDAALKLALGVIETVWPTEQADVLQARALVESYPALRARDLLHLASCQRRGVTRIQTYDRALASAFTPARR